jgi:hypothetical protein
MILVLLFTYSLFTIHAVEFFLSASAPAAATGPVLLPAVGAALGLGQTPLAVELLLAGLENEIVPALHAAQRPVARGTRTGFSRRKKLFDQSQKSHGFSRPVF